MSTPPKPAYKRRPRGEGGYTVDPRTGKPIFRSTVNGVRVKGRGHTRAEAKADHDRKVAHVIAGRSSGQPETFAVMAESWLTHRDHAHTRDNLRGARADLRNWLNPAIGEKPAEAVRPSDFEDVFEAMLTGGLLLDSMKRVRGTGSKAYAWAVGDGRVAGHQPGSLWNPAKAAKFPKAAEPSEPLGAPDPAAVVGLLSVTDHVHNGGLWRAMADCALRPSEAAGLRWQDIDLGADGGVAHIRGALRWDKANRVYRWHPGPKNEKKGGKRKDRAVEFGPDLAAVLHRQRAHGRSLQVASRWPTEPFTGDLVFRGVQNGSGLDQQHVYRKHTRYIAQAGVAHFAPYQLRHHLPTLLYAAGWSVDAIADFLGDDPETVRRFYIDRPEVAIPFEAIRGVLTAAGGAR